MANPETSSRLGSVVVPVFNEERNVMPLYEAVTRVFESIKHSYSLELIFTDNHSSDRTFEYLQELAAKDFRVKAIRFTRNYGFQRSLMTGYRLATGDAAIQIDCDLQDPPELIPTLLQLWENGNDVVVGLRQKREENFLLSWLRWAFYRLLNRISEDRLTPDAGDFRLVDKSILSQLRAIDHADPYVRGLISSLAVSETGVHYDRQARKNEKSKFPLRRLFGLAIHGIVSHSLVPLRLAIYAGIVVSMVTLFLCVYYFVMAILFGVVWPPGFATTTVLILFGISLNGIFMGILGEYIGRIYI